jgi:hypothetical protein
MLQTMTYNLMERATAISKALTRYEALRKDSVGCQPCQQLWDFMRRSEEEQLDRISAHLNHHVQQDTGVTIMAA